MPAASVGSEQTKNEWWNSCPLNIKERDCRPFTSSTFTFTPCGFIPVDVTSLLDTPGWNIEMLDPVSIIRFLCSPISIETGSALFYHNLNYRPLDSIFNSVKAERPVFCLHALRLFSDCLLFSLFAGNPFLPQDRERFEPSV